MSSWSWKTGLASVTLVAAMAYVAAQMPTGHDGMHAQTGPNTQGQQPVSPESGMHGPMHERNLRRPRALCISAKTSVPSQICSAVEQFTFGGRIVFAKAPSVLHFCENIRPFSNLANPLSKNQH